MHVGKRFLFLNSSRSSMVSRAKHTFVKRRARQPPQLFFEILFLDFTVLKKILKKIFGIKQIDNTTLKVFKECSFELGMCLG